MTRWPVSILAMFVLAGAALAQQPVADPVLAAYREYTAAQKNNDLAAAEGAAERAWRASETQSGDGGKTAVLAFNAALARLAQKHGAMAVEPARRALTLAEKGAAGVDPLQARLVLGEALAAENYAEAKTLLPPALETARSAGPEIHGAAYQAAVALGKAASDKRDWALSTAAWTSAFDNADGGAGEPEVLRAQALMQRGATLAAQRKDAEALESFLQAVRRLAPLAPERDDDQITRGEAYYAEALGWSAAVAARMRSQGKTVPGAPMRRAPLRGKPPPCPMAVDVSPRPMFPPSQMDAFGVGGVVLKISVDASGKVVSHGVLASIPSPDFGRVWDNPRAKWTVQAAKDAPAGCRMETTGHLFPVIFYLK